MHPMDGFGIRSVTPPGSIIKELVRFLNYMEMLYQLKKMFNVQ